MKLNSTHPGKLFYFKLSKINQTLDVGVTFLGEFYIELFNRKLIQPNIIVPHQWQRITITKQHQKLSLKVDHREEILQFEENLSKILVSEDALTFPGNFFLTNVMLF